MRYRVQPSEGVAVAKLGIENAVSRGLHNELKPGAAPQRGSEEPRCAELVNYGM